MENELQTNLDAILLDKNTNLKPENLKAGVTCLGVEGAAEVPTPIYATTDYRVLTVPKPEGVTANITSVFYLGDYYLINFFYNSYSHYYLYKKENNNLVLLTKVYEVYDNDYPGGIVGYNTTYVYMVMMNNSGDSDLYQFNLITNEIKSIYTYSSKITGGIVWSNNAYFNTSDNRTFKFDINNPNNGFTKINQNNPIFSTARNLNNIIPIFSDVFDSLIKLIIQNDVATYIESDRLEDTLLGVNYLGNKVFLVDGIYNLSDNLAVGEKLANYNDEIVSNLSKYNLICLNEKYYFQYNGGDTEDANLYEFNEDTNTLSLVETIPNIPWAIWHDDKNQISLYTTSSVYDFTTGDTLIGYRINGQNIYLNQSRNITTDKILNGYTSYTQDGSPISGTMPNNGDVTIAPTTSEQVKEKGYYNSLKVSAVTSAIDSNITPENIKKDISILGVTGTLEGGIDTSDANATADDIARGKTAYVNGEKIIGNIFTLGSTAGTTVDANGSVHDLPNYRGGIIRISHNFSDKDWLIRKGGGLNYDTTYANISNAIGLTGEQIKSGETVLGVEGTVIELKGQTKSVTPTINLQTIIPDENYNGLTSVEVSAVTSDIDENIKAENIKSGVEILGVTGTYGGSGAAGEIEITTAIVDKTIQYIPFKKDGTSLWNTSGMVDMYEFAKGCVNLETIPLLNTSSVTDMSYMFDGCTSLTTISLLDTSSVTSMQGMFYDCISLTTIPLLNTSNVEHMIDMFNGCTSLTTIPLLDISNVTSMGSMFNGCTSLITIPQLNISSAEETNDMFYNCTSLTTIPQLDTRSAFDMSSMFSNCTALVTVPQLNMNRADSITDIFANCNSLSNDSLNNILASLLTATSYRGTKTLARIGLSSTQATTCTTLSNYSAFTAAGWTTGY